MKNNNRKGNGLTALVTGGTSGIGLETAKALRDRGCRVFTLSRRPAVIPGITSLTADVTDEAAVKSAVSAVIKEAGQLDILVNCAGFGISGAVEFTELSDAKKQFDVNFFGAVNVTKAALPFMRERKSGMIVNISSVAAPVAIPFQAYYSAAKAALNAWTAALQNEIRPWGIRVTAVQPGDIRTGFTAGNLGGAAAQGEDPASPVPEGLRRLQSDTGGPPRHEGGEAVPFHFILHGE